MAIIKSFATRQGISANYHKIVRAEIDVASSTTTVTLAIYLSAEARDAGYAPLWHEYVSIPFDAMVGDFRNNLYGLVEGYWQSYAKDGEADESDITYSAVILKDEARLPPPEPEIVSEPETGSE